MFEEIFAEFRKAQREEFDRIMEPFHRDGRQTIADFVDVLSEQRRICQRRLWNHGWMIDLHFPYVSLEKAIEEGDAAEADIDEIMVEFFASREDEIEQEICEAWHHRSTLLAMAFDEHRAGRYFFSIPVMLAQADGMASDLLQTHFFNKDRKSGWLKVADALEQRNLDWKQFDALTILQHVNPLTGSDQVIEPEIMNRHRVMHGKDLDYGTEANSYRAIAVLQFVTHFLKPGADSLVQP